MVRRSRLKSWILALALCGALLAANLALAQESAAPLETAADAETAPTGLGTLILLLGVGAVVIVGGVMWFRDQYPGSTGKTE